MSTATLRATAAEPSAFLRLALRLDAVVSGANGVAYLAFAGALDGPLGLDATFLRLLGAFFVVFAATLWAISARERPATGAVKAIAAGNADYALASLAVAVLAIGTPTAGGTAWIVAQGLVVAGFGALQWTAVRARDAA